jgi:hypothetical protein
MKGETGAVAAPVDPKTGAATAPQKEQGIKGTKLFA